MTNDGNCILREVDVSHPAAKSMIELSRAQDEEVGDGTTSVIILSTFLRFHLFPLPPSFPLFPSLPSPLPFPPLDHYNHASSHLINDDRWRNLRHG